MTSVIIRQPGYIPNIGFFKKIESCDIFVFLDDAQYAIRAWDNRNKIKTKNGPVWISVPVIIPYKKKLNDVKIFYKKNWQTVHKELIKKNYQNAPFFKDYWNDIENILNRKWEYLIDLNLELIKYIISTLQLKTELKKSSEMNIVSKSSRRLLDICKKVNADCYISGINGKQYLDEEIFKNEGIKVVYENFQHPIYKQINGDLIKNMSIIDLLFNEGDNSKNIIKDAKNLET